jgi:hypothetical protein
VFFSEIGEYQVEKYFRFFSCFKYLRRDTNPVQSVSSQYCYYDKDKRASLGTFEERCLSEAPLESLGFK